MNNGDRIPSISELRKQLNIELKESAYPGISLFDFIEKYIQEAHSIVNSNTGKPISRARIQIYKHTFVLLKEYSKARRKVLDFNDIDHDFYYDFVEFLKETRNLSNNSIGKHISTLHLTRFHE